MTTLTRGDEVEVHTTGTVLNPDSHGYVEIDTPAGPWFFHKARHKITVTKPAAPAWWPPRPGDVATVNNGSEAYPCDVVVARREAAWEVVDLTYTSEFPVGWSDSQVLNASPRLITRGRRRQGI